MRREPAQMEFLAVTGTILGTVDADLFTSNRPVDDLGKLLGGKAITALLDRVPTTHVR
jgi:hypothetical protein